jgi:hypothetical protein
MVQEGAYGLEYEQGCGGLIVAQINNEFTFHEQFTILIVVMFLSQVCKSRIRAKIFLEMHSLVIDYRVQYVVGVLRWVDAVSIVPSCHDLPCVVSPSACHTIAPPVFPRFRKLFYSIFFHSSLCSAPLHDIRSLGRSASVFAHHCNSYHFLAFNYGTFFCSKR